MPCIINQAYNSAKLTGITDKNAQMSIINETMKKLLNYDRDITGPHFSDVLQSIVVKYSEDKSPYSKIKQQNLNKARLFIPYLSNMIDEANDKLEMAIRASIAGNTIDLGANPDYNLEGEINRISSNNINLEALPQFKADLQNAENILFIGDNYEEAIFDKLLIKELRPKKITFATRSAEILNDITLSDAHGLGVDKLCRVIESGSKIAGTDLNSCSNEFLELFENADMVISKGQGNYETLLYADRPIYFMFKVKCNVIADICGNPVGRSVLYYHDGKKENLDAEAI
jgi:uncharacterized protein with ATP-grasp and redox domains